MSLFSIFHLQLLWSSLSSASFDALMYIYLPTTISIHAISLLSLCHPSTYVLYILLLSMRAETDSSVMYTFWIINERLCAFLCLLWPVSFFAAAATIILQYRQKYMQWALPIFSYILVHIASKNERKGRENERDMEEDACMCSQTSFNYETEQLWRVKSLWKENLLFMLISANKTSAGRW